MCNDQQAQHLTTLSPVEVLSTSIIDIIDIRQMPWSKLAYAGQLFTTVQTIPILQQSSVSYYSLANIYIPNHLLC